MISELPLASPAVALSVRQPWAWAIAHGGKTIENRDWRGCSYRGPIYIHASQWPTAIGPRSESMLDMVTEARSMLQIAAANGVPLPNPVTPRDLLDQRGCIVATARIVGEVYADCALGPCVCDGRERGVKTRGLTDIERSWYRGGYALLLADVKPTRMVRCRGALGLWPVPAEVLGQLHAA